MTVGGGVNPNPTEDPPLADEIKAHERVWSDGWTRGYSSGLRRAEAAETALAEAQAELREMHRTSVPGRALKAESEANDRQAVTITGLWVTLAKIRELHTKLVDRMPDEICRGCYEPWPCRTAALLDGHQ